MVQTEKQETIFDFCQHTTKLQQLHVIENTSTSDETTIKVCVKESGIISNNHKLFKLDYSNFRL